MNRALSWVCVLISLVALFPMDALGAPSTDSAASVLWLEKYTDVRPFSCGYAWVAENEAKWYIDKSGRQLTLDQPYAYLDVAFHGGLAAVMLSPAGGTGGKMGWIGTDGSLKIPVEYDSRYYSQFMRNTIPAIRYDDRRLVTLNTSGDEISVAPASVNLTEAATPSSNGLIPVVLRNSSNIPYVGFADLNWDIVIPAEHQDVYNGFYGGAASVYKYGERASDGGINLYAVNVDGKQIGAPISDNNYLGIQMLTLGFGNGLLAVENDQKLWGAMDTHGKLVIPYKYDMPIYFREGYAFALNGGTLQIINTDNEVIISDVQADIDLRRDYINYTFSEGLAAISRSGKWGYIDSNGEEVIPCQFEKAEAFSEGVAWVCREDGTWGIISSPLAIKSEWATAELAEAYTYEIVTQRTNHQFTQPMTRLQCAELMVNLAELLTGRPIMEAEGNRFDDTRDWMPLKAAQAEIVLGIGDGSCFAPEDLVTREQFSVMLYRTLMFAEWHLQSGSLKEYRDKQMVSSWAHESMGALVNTGIMKGLSSTLLSPKNEITVEQGVLLALRTYLSRRDG